MRKSRFTEAQKIAILKEDDKWFHPVHDTVWRIIGTFRQDDSDPKEERVLHQAGLSGLGLLGHGLGSKSSVSLGFNPPPTGEKDLECGTEVSNCTPHITVCAFYIEYAGMTFTSPPEIACASAQGCCSACGKW